MGTVPLGVVQVAAGCVAQEIDFCFIGDRRGMKISGVGARLDFKHVL
jgi:hypothetical protein